MWSSFRNSYQNSWWQLGLPFSLWPGIRTGTRTALRTHRPRCDPRNLKKNFSNSKLKIIFVGTWDRKFYPRFHGEFCNFCKCVWIKCDRYLTWIGSIGKEKTRSIYTSPIQVVSCIGSLFLLFVSFRFAKHRRLEVNSPQEKRRRRRSDIYRIQGGKK